MLLAVTLLAAMGAGRDSFAKGRSASGGRNARSSAAQRARVGPIRARDERSRARGSGNGARVAVQPFEGPATEPLRALVVRMVRGRGFRATTALPHYEGTGQYPGLARDHHLAAFVTADLEERGSWHRITFLVWNGASGSVLGRWTASAPASNLGRAVGRGFWAHLGPALRRASAPSAPSLGPAAPMRIDASDELDDPVAAR